MKYLILVTCLICLSIISQAQETDQNETNQKQEKILFKVKDGSNPDVYIDGKKYDSDILDLLDPDKIESISVIKGEEALKEYNSTNGVLLIKSKKESETISSINIRSTEGCNQPKIIIDGKLRDQDKLSKISPDNIHSINVVKGKKAIEEYDAPNGVIIITTKKGKK